MKLEGKKIIVVGLGRSGVAAADLCARLGAMVTGTDRMSADYASKQVLELAENGIEVALGGHEGVAWTEADMVVVSPGVPQFSGLVEAERAGAEVIGELELASRLVRAPIGVIGGTNGKSTVTSWVGQMLSGPGRKVFVGGNLGTPLAEQALDTFDHVILEVSSFQAERIQQLRPRAAALLNITDDHLDRYESFDAYAHTKGNVFVNMGSDDTAIVPAGDELCAKQANRGGARQATFGSGGDVSIVGNEIVDRIHGWTFPRSGIKLAGRHNELNACAAIALAGALGGQREQIGKALNNFTGLKHRAQWVAQVGSVVFYNDSKATNVGAAVAALRGLRQERAVLIAGGRDKLGSYAPLVSALSERGRALVVLGEAADKIADAARSAVPVLHAKTMQDAVQKAWESACDGDAVLLSPACSSFDMFKSYVERGDAFCRAVNVLTKAEARSEETR